MAAVSKAISDEKIPGEIDYCRQDLIFTREKLKTPLLFAHRGGVLEAPESTFRAFQHAVSKAKADVLELDVQLTTDGRFVVWHGPGLDNVYIQDQYPDPRRRPENKRNISDFLWCELAGKAWVADPCACSLTTVLEDKDGRELLLLSRFLELFPDKPLNIEMKETFLKKLGGRNGLKDNIQEFLRILKTGKHHRTIIVASARHKIIKEFRKQSQGEFPTNLSPLEQIVLKYIGNLNDRVLETVYHPNHSSAAIVKKVHSKNGSIYVFLTGILTYPAIDREPKKEEIEKILDRGVDGIMTDRPVRIREIMDEWIEKRCGNRRQ